MRGYAAGFLTGIVLALLALAALSPVMGGPGEGALVAEAGEEAATAPAAQPAAEAPEVVEDQSADAQDNSQPAQEQPDSGVETRPASEPAAPAPEADAPPTAEPAASEPAPELAAPEPATEDEPESDDAAPEPQQAESQPAPKPPAPETATASAPATELAAPASEANAPQPASPGPAPEPGPAPAAVAEPAPALAPETAPEAPAATALPRASDGAEPAPAPDTPPPHEKAAPAEPAGTETGALASDAPSTAGEAPATAPAQAPEAPAQSVKETPDVDQAQPVPEAPEATTPPDATGAAPVPGLAPAPPLGDQAAGVTTDRLPRIGDDTAAAAPAPEPVSELDADLPPLLAGARPFEADPALPRFAVILLDIGAAGLPRADLARLPFAVTFAIDPLAPDAAAAAAEYRAAGQEVVLLAPPLPEGATPADVETAIEAAALALPQAVAMLERPAAEGAERRLAAQAVPILKAQGRGLVTQGEGLAAAAQAAQREGLPQAEVYRLLDAEGEAAPVILRYLDRAAFKAKQEGQVLVLGQTRPETVAALSEWAMEGQGATLALAPLTALMPVAAP